MYFWKSCTAWNDFEMYRFSTNANGWSRSMAFYSFLDWLRFCRKCECLAYNAYISICLLVAFAYLIVTMTSNVAGQLWLPVPRLCSIGATCITYVLNVHVTMFSLENVMQGIYCGYSFQKLRKRFAYRVVVKSGKGWTSLSDFTLYRIDCRASHLETDDNYDDGLWTQNCKLPEFHCSK